MSAKKKKTILRTIRLTEEIDNMLERDAEEQNVSANALISKIMTRYVEWDRVIDKTSYIILSSMLFRALINEISDQKLEEIGQNFVSKAVKELAMVEFGKTDFESLMKTFFLISKYDTSMRVSAPLPAESKTDSRYTLTVYHDFGLKGGVLLKGYVESVVRNELGTQPTINITEDVITVSFHQPSKSRL